MAQFDLRHIVGLNFIDAETDHQVGHNFRFLFGGADDVDGLVDVQQDGRKALEQMQTLFLAVQVKIGAAADALHPERGPLLQNFAHAHDLRLAGHQNVEVRAEAVLQRGGLEQLRHQLFGIHAALEVQRELQTVQIRLVAHVADLFDLARLDQLGDLVHDGFHGRGGRNLSNFQHIFAGDHIIAGTHFDAAAAVLVDLPHLGFIVQNLSAAHEIRRGHGGGDVVLRVLHQSNGGVAQLGQIERADVARHADRDAQRIVRQDRGEGHRQKGGFGGGSVVVRDEIDGLLVDVPEQLFADAFQLGFGVTGCGAGHVPAVGLAEVALAVHKGDQQTFVAPAHADHRIIDGSIAVGVQVHGAAHDVGGLGASTLEQTHTVHRIEQLAVGGLEAVDLGQGAGDDDAHRIGHIVGFQGAGDGVLKDAARVQDLNAVAQLRADRFERFFCCSFCHSLSSLSNSRI